MSDLSVQPSPDSGKGPSTPSTSLYSEGFSLVKLRDLLDIDLPNPLVVSIGNDGSMLVCFKTTYPGREDDLYAFGCTVVDKDGHPKFEPISPNRFSFNAMNDLGQVVGNYYPPRQLPKTSGTEAYVKSVIDSVHVAGFFCETGECLEPNLGNNVHDYSALDINNQTTICGLLKFRGEHQQHVYRIGSAGLELCQDKIQELSTSSHTLNARINDQGSVAYCHGKAAYIWHSDGSIQALESDSYEPMIKAINNSNIVVGKVSNSLSDKACYWVEGKLQLIPAPSSWQASEALAINDHGHMIGTFMTEKKEGAFLFDGHQVINLGRLVPELRANIHLVRVRDINNQGVIVGDYFKTKDSQLEPFILTPKLR